jgi:hypothetical protein
MSQHTSPPNRSDSESKISRKSISLRQRKLLDILTNKLPFLLLKESEDWVGKLAWSAAEEFFQPEGNRARLEADLKTFLTWTSAKVCEKELDEGELPAVRIVPITLEHMIQLRDDPDEYPVKVSLCRLPAGKWVDMGTYDGLLLDSREHFRMEIAKGASHTAIMTKVLAWLNEYRKTNPTKSASQGISGPQDPKIFALNYACHVLSKASISPKIQLEEIRWLMGQSKLLPYASGKSYFNKRNTFRESNRYVKDKISLFKREWLGRCGSLPG